MNEQPPTKREDSARLTGYYALIPRRRTIRLSLRNSVFIAIFIVLFLPLCAIRETYQAHSSSAAALASELVAHDTLEYLMKFPLAPTEFGQMGQRVQLIAHRQDLLEKNRRRLTAQQSQTLAERLDEAVVASFPFVRNPFSPVKMPFQALRNRYKKGSKGIVISLGKKDFQYACHLISGIRHVLGSTLPIQIAYAGDDDLPLEYREKLMSLGNDIETMDLLRLIDDTTMDLAHGTFAIKPMAMLLSSFEQVMIVDADAIFLQPPEVLFKSKRYQDTGTYFFHDRLMYPNGFPERHAWYNSHLRFNQPSASLLNLTSYKEGYSDEQESGVVLLDKGRTPVLLGLLHICWQNSAAGREHMIWTEGDKETFWLGLEMCQVPYYFAKHYAIGLGPINDGNVCGNAIAHLDEKDRLLWFNGALLANKHGDKRTYGNFTHYILDGHWEPLGALGENCENQGVVLRVSEQEKKVLSGSIREAKLVDERFQDLLFT